MIGEKSAGRDEEAVRMTGIALKTHLKITVKSMRFMEDRKTVN